MPPVLRRRLAILLTRKPAVISIAFLAALASASLAAEWLCGSRPIVGEINGRLIAPAYIDYNREDVGLAGAGTVNYRDLRGAFTWAVWPVYGWDPYENDTDLDVIVAAPSGRHVMGTDVAGRDVFARLLYGTRVSFLFAVSVWILSDLIGLIIGLTQGFAGGRLDLLGQRVVEIFSSVPVFFLLLLLISLVTPSVGMLIPLAVIFGWVGISQYMRGEALRNKALAFCDAARALGATPSRILFRHVLPNSITPLVTFAPFTIVGGIMTLAGLDLLGFGVPAPTPSWGELLDQARKNFQIAWWLAVFPSLFLFLTIVALNLVGEALRATFDPRAKT